MPDLNSRTGGSKLSGIFNVAPSPTPTAAPTVAPTIAPTIAPTVAPTEPPAIPPKSSVVVRVVMSDGVPVSGAAVSVSEAKDISGVTDAEGKVVLDFNAPLGTKFTIACLKAPFTILPITITIGENSVLQEDGSMLYTLLATAYIPFSADITNTRTSLAYYPTLLYNWNNSLVLSPDGKYFYFIQDWPRCIVRGDISQISKWGSKATVAVTDPPKVTVFAGCADGSITGVTDGTGEAASFESSYNMAMSNSGAFLYVGDTYCVRRVDTATGEVKTIAGDPTKRWTGTGTGDGTGSDARFNATSWGMAVSPDDQYLYLIDTQTVRSINLSDFTVKTIAGSLEASGDADGPGADARFNSLYGLVITSDGKNLYTYDNGTDKIRKLVLNSDRVTCTVSTITPTATDPLNGTDLTDLTISPDDKTLYISDVYNRQIRALDLATNTLTAVAGKLGEKLNVDGIGEDARLTGPQGSDITKDGKYLFFVDYCPHYVRVMNLQTREVRTLIGGICEGWFREGFVMEAASPYSFTINSADSQILFFDRWRQYSNYIFGFNLLLDQFVNTEHITTGFYGYQDGPIKDALFNEFTAFDSSKDGNTLYAFSDNCLRKIDRINGVVSTVLGEQGINSTADGDASVARIGTAYRAAVKSDESELYFYDSGKLRAADLKAPSIKTIPDFPNPYIGEGPAMAFTPDDKFLYIIGQPPGGNRVVLKMDTTAAVKVFEEVKLKDSEGNPLVPADYIRAITLSSDGKRLFFADRHIVYYADLDTLIYRKIAGTDVAPPFSYKLPSGQAGLDTYFEYITDLELSSDGAVLYVSDSPNHCIRRLIITP